VKLKASNCLLTQVNEPLFVAMLTVVPHYNVEQNIWIPNPNSQSLFVLSYWNRELWLVRFWCLQAYNVLGKEMLVTSLSPTSMRKRNAYWGISYKIRLGIKHLHYASWWQQIILFSRCSSIWFTIQSKLFCFPDDLVFLKKKKEVVLYHN